MLLSDKGIHYPKGCDLKLRGGGKIPLEVEKQRGFMIFFRSKGGKRKVVLHNSNLGMPTVVHILDSYSNINIWCVSHSRKITKKHWRSAFSDSTEKYNQKENLLSDAKGSNMAV